jgi:hypothetical protein
MVRISEEMQMSGNWLFDLSGLALLCYGVACCVVPAGRPPGESTRAMLRAYARRSGPLQQHRLVRQAEAALARKDAGFTAAAEPAVTAAEPAPVAYHDAGEATLQPADPADAGHQPVDKAAFAHYVGHGQRLLIQARHQSV